MLEGTEFLEVSYYLITGLSILVGLIRYLHTSRQEQRRKERETYQSVSSVYLNLLLTSLQNADVPLFDEHLMLKYFGITTDDPEIVMYRRRWILYSLVVNCFENAYLALHAAPRRAHRAQWAGWEEWIVDTLSEPEFRRMWEDFGDSFDGHFRAHVDGLLAGVETEAEGIVASSA